MTSTLQLTYYDLIERVGDYLGVGMSPHGDDLARVRMRIEDGYRRFLNPPILPGEQAPHLWSWLAPATTLAILADTEDYDLPTDFSQLIGTFNYASGESTVHYIEVTSVDRVMRARADADEGVGGRPYMVAIRPKTPSTTAGQTYEVLFYPTPSAALTLHYRYVKQQNKLDTAIVEGTGDVVADDDDAYTILRDTGVDFSGVSAGDIVIISNADGPTEGIYTVASTTDIDESASPSPSPSPWADTITVTGDFGAGGTCNYEVLPATILPLGECSEALVESCLAVAETFHDDAEEIHSRAFMRLIADCIMRDRMRGPRTLGYNADRSDGVTGNPSRLDGTYTYDGTLIT